MANYRKVYGELKSDKEIIINLQMFADDGDDDDFNIDDFNLNDDDDDNDGDGDDDGDNDGDDDGDNDGDNKKKKKDENWFLPGIAKTKEDASKYFKKTQQYTKQLEAKLSAKADGKDGDGTGSIQTSTQIAQEDVIDKAMKDLNITDDELAINGVESQKKIMRYMMEDLIPKLVTQPLLQNNGAIQGNILKDKIRVLYPNFDIDTHEDKIANVLKSRYKPDYIKRNSFSLISKVVESMGGKKTRTPAGEPFSETPTSGGGSSVKGGSIHDKVREDIMNAKIGGADLFKGAKRTKI